MSGISFPSRTFLNVPLIVCKPYHNLPQHNMPTDAHDVVLGDSGSIDVSIARIEPHSIILQLLYSSDFSTSCRTTYLRSRSYVLSQPHIYILISGCYLTSCTPTQPLPPSRSLLNGAVILKQTTPLHHLFSSTPLIRDVLACLVTLARYGRKRILYSAWRHVACSASVEPGRARQDT